MPTLIIVDDEGNHVGEAKIKKSILSDLSAMLGSAENSSRGTILELTIGRARQESGQVEQNRIEQLSEAHTRIEGFNTLRKIIEETLNK